MNDLRFANTPFVQFRQVEILKLLLELDEGLYLEDIIDQTEKLYGSLKSPRKATTRDLNHLIRLGAMKFEKTDGGRYRLFIDLDWPTKITETDFFQTVRDLPKDKTYSFLR